MATGAGDPAPAIDVKPVMQGNLPARALTYAGKSRPNRLRVDGIVVQDGLKMWHVVVTYQSDFHAADAERVIKSIRVKAS